jgi:hypothetical protein
MKRKEFLYCIIINLHVTLTSPHNMKHFSGGWHYKVFHPQLLVSFAIKIEVLFKVLTAKLQALHAFMGHNKPGHLFRENKSQ